MGHGGPVNGVTRLASTTRRSRLISRNVAEGLLSSVIETENGLGIRIGKRFREDKLVVDWSTRNFKYAHSQSRSMPVTRIESFEKIERLVSELLDLVADYGRMLNTHP